MACHLTANRQGTHEDENGWTVGSALRRVQTELEDLI
jgi:hypothetical protein